MVKRNAPLSEWGGALIHDSFIIRKIKHIV